MTAPNQLWAVVREDGVFVSASPNKREATFAAKLLMRIQGCGFNAIPYEPSDRKRDRKDAAAIRYAVGCALPKTRERVAERLRPLHERLSGGAK